MNTNLKVRYNLLVCESKVLQKLLLIHGIFFPSCFIVPMFPIFNANTENIVGTILLEIWYVYFLPICILGYNYLLKS